MITPTLLGAIEAPRAAEHVAHARHFVGKTLEGEFPQHLDIAVLLVSELFTNSVLHGGGAQVSVRVLRAGLGVRVEVIDEGGKGVPCLRRSDDEIAEDGRGMCLVDALAKRWGFTKDLAGTSSWPVI